MDEDAARAAFEIALKTHSPGFGTFFLARLLGLDISYGEDTCSVKMPVQDFMYNPQGSLHGGIIGTVLDISMGHLLVHAIGVGMTLEMRTQFLRPARTGTVLATSRFLKKGKSINFLESRMVDADGKDMAVATSTWQLLA
jgi:acyl-CoA thioesterase